MWALNIDNLNGCNQEDLLAIELHGKVTIAHVKATGYVLWTKHAMEMIFMGASLIYQEMIKLPGSGEEVFFLFTSADDAWRGGWVIVAGIMEDGFLNHFYFERQTFQEKLYNFTIALTFK